MIVVLSIAGIGMEKMKSGQVLPINPTLIRVMRVLRIARGNDKIRFCDRMKLFYFSTEIIKNGQRYSSSIRYSYSSSSTSGKFGKLIGF